MHVVMYSGGVGSWLTAHRVAEQYGIDDLVLLFADTLVEDEDLYRFLDETATHIGVPITRVADGRTPQQVDVDRRWLSNARVAQCSTYLKVMPCRAWLDAHADPATTTLHVGIDWTETHRLPAIVKGWEPWRVAAPLTTTPHYTREDMLAALSEAGIAPPRLYELGFPHNNCGGACVRGGQRQWKQVLKVFPERYAMAERHEQRMRTELGKEVAILRDRSGGGLRPLTLRELRHKRADPSDWGGCGCFTEMG